MKRILLFLVSVAGFLFTGIACDRINGQKLPLSPPEKVVSLTQDQDDDDDNDDDDKKDKKLKEKITEILDTWAGEDKDKIEKSFKELTSLITEKNEERVIMILKEKLKEKWLDDDPGIRLNVAHSLEGYIETLFVEDEEEIRVILSTLLRLRQSDEAEVKTRARTAFYKLLDKLMNLGED